jgi:hypothetical protein
LLPDGREHSGSDPNDLNGLNIAAMFVVSALDKFRLAPVKMVQISPCAWRPAALDRLTGICEMQRRFP